MLDEEERGTHGIVEKPVTIGVASGNGDEDVPNGHGPTVGLNPADIGSRVGTGHDETFALQSREHLRPGERHVSWSTR